LWLDFSPPPPHPPSPPHPNYSSALAQVLAHEQRNTEIELIRKLEAQEIEIKAQAAEIKRQSEITDRLVASLLPQKVADTLKTGEAVQPEELDSVTIFSSDIVGFDRICSHCEPDDLVRMLNEMYTVIDQIAKDFGMHKLETRDGEYMCVAGLGPGYDAEHSKAAAVFAHAVKLAVAGSVKIPSRAQASLLNSKRLSSAHKEGYVELRIGLHTGACVAAVVGTLVPR
jgi:class 3 adenylate cyclase